MGIQKSKMESIVEENVDPADLKKFELIYLEQLKTGSKNISHKAQFDYAWCLVRSPNRRDLEKGCVFLEDLFKKTPDEGAKRDYLFYMCVGQTRLKNYEQALKYADAMLQVQPGNHQVQALKQYIQKKMKRDGLVGMAVIGGAAAVGLGAIVAAGMALGKK